MPEPLRRSVSAVDPLLARCQGCNRVLRPRERFCARCGRPIARTTVGAAAAAAATSGLLAPDGASASPSAAPLFARRWQALRRIGVLYGAWLAVSLVTGVAAHFTRSPWLEVVASTLGALLVLGFSIRCRELGGLLRLRSPSAATTRRLLAVAVGFVLLLSGYYALLGKLGMPVLHYLKEFRTAHWPLWSAFLLISLLPGIVEEIGFRGIIQSSLKQITGAREAWLIQAALFSLLHLSPLIFPDHFLMGLALGYLRSRSRSLYPGMALHAGWNALVLVQELLR